mgnify:CR=1 FL=1
MKNFIPITILSLVAICCLFFAFTDSSDSSTLHQLNNSKQVIAGQSACIDDLESSLYDFSTEINDLRAENTFLIKENKDLRSELYKQASRAAKLKSELTQLEIDNYNTKKQLDQILIGREIRARHIAKTGMHANVASLMPTPDVDANTTAETSISNMTKVQSRLASIKKAMENRTISLAAIEEETEKTFSTIQKNEAKIQYNIDVEPASNPTVSFTDPLVSQSPLFEEPSDSPIFFTTLKMDDEDIAMEANPATDEFSAKSPIISMVENTNVIYNYIACRTDRYGKKIKKLKKGAKNWKYTFLQFNLESENVNLLLNKSFRMRVLATDLNTYLDFTTDKEPTESANYFDFVYEGEPVKLSFFNEAGIKGESFDIQIFHIVDENEYLLEDDQHSLFTDGKNTINKEEMNPPTS